MARYLVERGCDPTGVDAAPEMIAMCESHLPRQTWLVADMRSLFLGRIFDGILAWDSFLHLCHDDQRRMFPVFRAHAAPGAALLFTSGPAHGAAIGAFRGEPLYHASLDGAEYRALLHENGFAVVAPAVGDPSCGGHTSGSGASGRRAGGRSTAISAPVLDRGARVHLGRQLSYPCVMDVRGAALPSPA